MTSRLNRGRNGSVATWINSLRSNCVTHLALRDEAEIEKEVEHTINTVEEVHWYIKYNAKKHNTIKFDQIHVKDDPKPVLRRGQSFYITLRFKARDVDVERDRIVLQFCYGPKASVTKGTMGVLLVKKNNAFTRESGEWDVRIDAGTRGKDLILEILTPASIPVGIWKLKIKSGVWNQTERKNMITFNEKTEIYILFNPWCKDDLVYLEDEKKRDEYVLNDKGKVYVGTHKSPRGRPWDFGQFDDVVLQVAAFILELSHHAYSERGNPVQVVRAISSGVNSCDNEGILEGKWGGDYSDGIAPFKWSGSVRILENYVRSGYKPVKYGQCWVFSALTTTICRALGIPCRSVTNFISAHDTNSSLTIDKFFDKTGNEMEGGPDGENYDSIWNFHVWNDVWMARTDLPPGYGGWQAIDATPQEESDRMMRCGPASHEAIRRGDIGLAFDCPFIFAEVNADIMHWIEDENSEWGFARTKMNKYHVGRLILTRKAGEEDDFGDEDKENVLKCYKDAEGSQAERLAIHNAIRGSKRAQQYYEYNSDITEDVVFDLVEIDKIEIGDTFKIKVSIKNTSNETRKVSAALTARSLFYNGIISTLIKSAEGIITIPPGNEQEIALTIEYNEYWKLLEEQCMIKIYTICKVQETGQTWSEEDDFQVEKPKLNIEIDNEAKKGEICKCIVNFKNPLDEKLTNCELSIDGSGLLRPKSITITQPIEANCLFYHRFEFTPLIHGQRKLVVNFNSKQLFDIIGSRSITVAKN